jgi:hypothetical protein
MKVLQSGLQGELATQCGLGRRVRGLPQQGCTIPVINLAAYFPIVESAQTGFDDLDRASDPAKSWHGLCLCSPHLPLARQVLIGAKDTRHLKAQIRKCIEEGLKDVSYRFTPFHKGRHRYVPIVDILGQKEHRSVTIMPVPKSDHRKKQINLIL